MSKSPKGLQSSSGVKKKQKNKETKPKILCFRDAITLCKNSLILLSLQRTVTWLKVLALADTWEKDSKLHDGVNNGRGQSLTCRIMSDEKQKRSVYYKPGRRWPCNQNRSCGKKRKTHCTPSMRPQRQHVSQGRTSFPSQRLAMKQQAPWSPLTAQPPWARPFPIHLI